MMKRLILVFYIFSCLISCKEEKIDEELIIPEDINIEKLPTFTGGELIEGRLIAKDVNWQLSPITSMTEIIGGLSMYSQGEPLFILRKDSTMIVIGYKGKILPPNSGADIPMTCKDDESKKIINMISFFKNGYPNYPSNFLFQVWNKSEIIKSAQRNYSKNSIQLKSYTIYKTTRNNKNIPIVLLNLQIKAVDNKDINIFDGNINFCYVPRAKSCE